jgi:hypothetical protein
MKGNMLLIIIFLLCLQQISAQNYQTVKSDRIAYYADVYDNINCIRFDSVSEQADSIYYPFSNIDLVDNYGCNTPYGPSWIGKKVIIRKDGYNLFFNRNKDTIRIKTNAQLHEVWTAFKAGGSEIIRAEVASIDTLSFLGLSDSVKTIEFQVYNTSMVPIVHALNDMTLLLSRNFGFIRTTNFNLFPDLIGYHGPLQELILIGLSKPSLGIQNLTWFEVFDFQPGDEIHEYYKTYSIDSQEIRKKIAKYLERTDFEDSIIYRVELTQTINKNWIDGSYFDYSQDTINILIRQDTLFNKLPGEPIISDNLTYSYAMNKQNNLSKVQPSYSDKYFFQTDSCWMSPVIDDCDPYFNYVKGLGGPYYECDNGFSYGGTENSLVYYKKGQSAWGVPLIITAIPNVPLQPIVTVFPNPTSDRVWIIAPESVYPFIFELVSINGQVLNHSNMVSPATSINVSKYGRGTFLYRLLDINGNMISGKLVIE